MWPRSRRQTRRTRFVPRLEALEGRDCPSGGLLDPTFGDTGTKTLSDSVSGNAGAMVVQPDGKIVSVGGHWLNGIQQTTVTRLNRDGSLDTSFNKTGSVNIKVGNFYTNGGAVALQPDGKILVGGSASVAKQWFDPNLYTDTQYVVARLNANGSLDTKFAKNGLFTSNPTSRGEGIGALAVLADGSILAGGTGGVAGKNEDAMTVLKLTASGTLDSTFGSGGVVQVHIGSWDSMGGMAVVPTTGQIALAGSTRQGPDSNAPARAALAMLTPGGQPDTSFNGTGWLVYAPADANQTWFGQVVVQGNPTQGYKLVVSAELEASQVTWLVGRYTLSGALDTTFGGTGTGFFTLSTSGPDWNGLSMSSLALARDGSIVIAGTHLYAYDPATTASYNEMFVAHLSADGALDTAFGPNSTGISYARPSANTTGGGLAIDPIDGGILVSGRWEVPLSSTGGAAFARFTAP